MGNGRSRVRGLAARAGGWSARHRWAAGRTALRIAAATSGHAIVVSGVTVCVAMAGMLFTGLAESEAVAPTTSRDDEGERVPV